MNEPIQYSKLFVSIFVLNQETAKIPFRSSCQAATYLLPIKPLKVVYRGIPLCTLPRTQEANLVA